VFQRQGAFLGIWGTEFDHVSQHVEHHQLALRFDFSATCTENASLTGHETFHVRKVGLSGNRSTAGLCNGRRFGNGFCYGFSYLEFWGALVNLFVFAIRERFELGVKFVADFRVRSETLIAIEAEVLKVCNATDIVHIRDCLPSLLGYAKLRLKFACLHAQTSTAPCAAHEKNDKL